MTLTSLADLDRRRAVLWGALVLGAVVSTFAFACAAPLAGLAAAAALAFGRREALIVTAAIWLANQLVGFAFLHYPLDASTLFWGAALGVVALVCCEAARLVAQGSNGVPAHVAAFLASFVVYEGTLAVVTVATGGDTSYYLDATVLRIFLVNAVAFACGAVAAVTLAASSEARGAVRAVAST